MQPPSLVAPPMEKRCAHVRKRDRNNGLMICFSKNNDDLDVDSDGVIGPEDLRAITTRLCAGERGLSPAEIDDVVEKILDESDVDCDGHLTAMEFGHVVARAPDFITTFHIRI